MESNDARPTLYMIPTVLSDAPVDRAIPAANIALTARLRHFVVENVRTARRFLRRCDPAFPIDDCSFATLNVNTRPEEIPALLKPLAEGCDVGVISEAGCPGVADPGCDLVAAAQERGYRVVPLVGPSSIIMSLMGSGFNGQSFAFLGYLPIDGGERAARLKKMQSAVVRDSQTQIFIETPYRNNKLIAEIAATLSGDLKLCVASNLTADNQSVITRRLSDWKRADYDYHKIPTIFLLYK